MAQGFKVPALTDIHSQSRGVFIPTLFSQTKRYHPFSLIPWLEEQLCKDVVTLQWRAEVLLVCWFALAQHLIAHAACVLML